MFNRCNESQIKKENKIYIAICSLCGKEKEFPFPAERFLCDECYEEFIKEGPE